MKKVILVCLTFLTCSATAAIFQVNLSVQDHVDENPGDGVCKIAAGDFCTLRAAVMEANALPGADIIIIEGNTTVRLSITGANENFAATGDLDIRDSVAIGTFVESTEDYPTVDGSVLGDRIFSVLANNNELVQFINFKIVNGDATGNGGGIYVGPGNQVAVQRVWFEDNTADSGGAIYAAATSTLDIIDSVFVGNAAVSQGGAITTYADTQIEKTTIYDNLNFNNDRQEAIFVGYSNLGEDGLTIRNSTVFNNDRTGIYSVAADISIRNTTIADHNLGFGVVADVGSVVPELRMRNSVLFDNNTDCGVTNIDYNVNNWNITSDQSCIVGGSTSLTEDPKMTSIRIDAENWHRYYRPGFYSPVVDSAHPSAPGPGLGCEAEDQRGVTRPQDGDHSGSGRCDRGSIELLDDVIFYDTFGIQY